ncbi:flagellar hook protein FlgE [Bradyrhizobium sp. U87765 SZCCT0131]|nr:MULTISPECIES: flagellar hook protein FlgE [unclassified Bradyrhizobium]MBR1216379.1 flagellar hook protein FlgE [Bradyrhizobium sp. U87765 SZCCT0131]MBR1259873.1 flagellar hook protein FlgE [Bradyrhizobium sp. U87765 SZCCT0134]MBR1306006.1 flagellar hook protein FlgE [Bradyrhizobium sp. U87765 SZCCT0110]MBR1322373.1 flagellar hook protein FlgE [Bradyrhizobium sp. U87765 SZCCT0109]MBR1352336.1 flagellar hook protein FlgE [Bradyrhizobium sp. U87765 SZCCT0048]
MSLYGVMRTGGSGMTAQSNKLSTVADNIANVNTSGYKRASTEFSSLILKSGSGSYNSGGVETQVRYAIADPGPLQYTTSATDLAIQGNGFFVVSNGAGTPFLTRAGSFVPDGQGNLVNAAGYYLMGYSLKNGAPNVVANGLTGLDVVNIAQTALQGNPSTKATISSNLNANAAVTAGVPNYTSKTSVVTYDNIGNKVTLDVYMSKTAADTWNVQVYNSANSTNGGFPYSSPALASSTFTFDVSATGKGKLAAASPTSMALTVPGGSPMTLDFSAMTQVASEFAFKATVDGNAPSSIDKVEVDPAGTMYAVYTDGTRLATYRIPLATVPSPDNLVPEAGNVYSVGINSGNVQVDFAGRSGLGTMKSEALEQSNVDLASELTAMIESQRGYTANSKVFQTGADLLDVLVNLKR